ncbi:hypothetical protein COB52_00415, partial [Candidatus Kaiserbacteria bacterium]
MGKIIAEQRVLEGSIAGVVITHVQGDGSDHDYIDQDVTTAGNPTFNTVNITASVSAPNIVVDTIDENTVGAGVLVENVLLKDSEISITSTTDSTNVSTGALRIDGGIGLDGSLYSGGTISALNSAAPSGTHIDLTTNTALPTIIIDKGDGVGGSLSRWDVFVNGSNGLTIRDETNATDNIISDTSGIVSFPQSVKVNTISEYTTNNGVIIDDVAILDNTLFVNTINERILTNGVTIDGVLLKDNQVNTNTINELTAASGVTIDGVLLKDGGAVFIDGASIEIDTINEATSAAGVTIDSVILKDNTIAATSADYTSAITVDTINEHTVTAGVTIDSVLLKDGGIILVDGASMETDSINEATTAVGVTIEGVLLKDSDIVIPSSNFLSVDIINETTSAAGVTVDGVLLKDGGAVFADGASVEIDTINEATSTAGVTVDGVLLKDGGAVFADGATIEIDTINEATSAAGITIDGILLQDTSGITLPGTGGNISKTGAADFTVTAAVNRNLQLTVSGSGEVRVSGGDLIMNSNSITNLAEPSASGDAATKNYVDTVAQGLDSKESCRLKTIATLSAYTQSGTGIGATLTADANGQIADIDGFTPSVSNRILVDTSGTATGADRGIYTLTQLGDGSNPWILTRATDFDQDSEVTSGAFTFIEEGITTGGNGYVLATPDIITVDSTSMTFTQFSGAGIVIAGDGLTKSGNTLNVNPDTSSIEISGDQVRIASGAAGTGLSGGSGSSLSVDASQTQITAVGIIQTGTWASTITVDSISEETGAVGVTVDGVLLKDGGAVFADGASIEIDTINEATSAAGVTIDGTLLKDGGAVFADGASIE